MFGVLGISGEFHAADGQVVAAGEFGVDAEAGQGLHHRADKNLEVEARGGVLVHDKGKIQVACIVVHRPPPDRRRTTRIRGHPQKPD